jgi:hypothetical protein
VTEAAARRFAAAARHADPDDILIEPLNEEFSGASGRRRKDAARQPKPRSAPERKKRGRPAGS